MFEGAKHKWIAGMVHLSPLPSTPFGDDDLAAIRRNAIADAVSLEQGGASGCLIQTMDRVYSPDDECDPARVAAMALIVSDVVHACGPYFDVGVQIMKNAITASLAVAAMAGAKFIRASAWVGETDSAFGTVTSNPEKFCAYRRRVAPDIAVIADIHTQHFRWKGTSVDLSRVAHWAMEAKADAVCLGTADADETKRLIEDARNGIGTRPIILSGYTSIETAAARLAYANGAFVGGCLKDQKSGRVDAKAVASYVNAVKASAP